MSTVLAARPALSRPAPTSAPACSLSVVIPAYNEERRLPPTLEAVHSFFARRGDEFEIIVVDDGSSDRTLDAVHGLQASLPGLRVLRQPRNLGKGAAVRAGVLASRGGAVLFSDADLSTPIECVDLLWPWLGRGYDVAIGSRSRVDSEVLVHQSFVRENMGRTFNRIVGLLGVRGIRDTQCGFKLFSARAAKRLFAGLRTRGFAFDVEVLIRARRLGYRIAEVGVRWINSSDSRVRAGRDSCKMLLEILRMRGLA
jgi:dolichyl-phosphate beta-glucosyltransferase